MPKRSPKLITGRNPGVTGKVVRRTSGRQQNPNAIPVARKNGRLSLDLSGVNPTAFRRGGSTLIDFTGKQPQDPELKLRSLGEPSQEQIADALSRQFFDENKEAIEDVLGFQAIRDLRDKDEGIDEADLVNDLFKKDPDFLQRPDVTVPTSIDPGNAPSLFKANFSGKMSTAQKIITAAALTAATAGAAGAFAAGGAGAGGAAGGAAGAGSAAGAAGAGAGAAGAGAAGGLALPSIAQGSSALALESLTGVAAGGGASALGPGAALGGGLTTLSPISKAAIPARRAVGGSSTLLGTLKNAGNAATIGAGLGSLLAGASVPSGIPGAGPPSRGRSDSSIKRDSTATEAETIAGLLTGEAELTPQERRRTRIPRSKDPAIEESRRSAIREERERTGRQSTILTSGRGVTDPLGEVDRPRARRRANPVARERIPALLGDAGSELKRNPPKARERGANDKTGSKLKPITPEMRARARGHNVGFLPGIDR